MGLGRPMISYRLLRHFNMIYLSDLEESTLLYMTTKIFEWGFEEHIDKVKMLTKMLTHLSLIIHKKVSSEFLPLPKKSHYLFNLRDLMKVVQGVLKVPP